MPRTVIQVLIAIILVIVAVILFRECSAPSERRAVKVRTVTTTLPATTSTTWEPPTTTTTTTLAPVTTTTTATTPPPAPASSTGPAEGSSEVFLACVRTRESENTYDIVDASGTWFGAYQFERPTWDNTARHAGRPDLVGVDPSQASPADQDAMARHLLAWQGRGPWAGGRYAC